SSARAQLPGRAPRKGRLFALEPLAGAGRDAPRLASGLAEFDRVTGGGFVRGSVLLLGGDPGIGKSTLLIQVAAALARGGHRAVYISGEEAGAQVRLRRERLGLADAQVELAAETSVEDIVATLSERASPRLAIIDSIQTMWTEMVEAAPGTVTQVRASAQALIRFAKRSGAAVILVGHVTKDGQMPGPRVVGDMVDAVLSFEGEGSHQFRILRAVKNRFGPTDEIGVFEMTGGGLREIANPSELFLSERDLGSPGTAVFAGIEGSRPLLVEIQALVAPTSLGTPRRAVNGWDPNLVVDGAGGARGQLRRPALGPRRLPQCRGRIAHPGAGGRPRRRRRTRLFVRRCPVAGRCRLLRRNLALGRSAPGGTGRNAAQGGAKARLCPCRSSRRAARGGDERAGTIAKAREQPCEPGRRHRCSEDRRRTTAGQARRRPTGRVTARPHPAIQRPNCRHRLGRALHVPPEGR